MLDSYLGYCEKIGAVHEKRLHTLEKKKNENELFYCFFVCVLYYNSVDVEPYTIKFSCTNWFNLRMQEVLNVCNNTKIISF